MILTVLVQPCTLSGFGWRNRDGEALDQHAGSLLPLGPKVVRCGVTIGDGCTTWFWFDSWMEGGAPFLAFPDLFLASRHKHRSIAEAMQEQRWVSDLRGRVTTDLLPAFVSLWLAAYELHLNTAVPDTFTWRCSESGSYSASSAYRMQFFGSTGSPLMPMIW